MAPKGLTGRIGSRASATTVLAPGPSAAGTHSTRATAKSSPAGMETRRHRRTPPRCVYAVCTNGPIVYVPETVLHSGIRPGPQSVPQPTRPDTRPEEGPEHQLSTVEGVTRCESFKAKFRGSAATVSVGKPTPRRSVDVAGSERIARDRWARTACGPPPRAQRLRLRFRSGRCLIGCFFPDSFTHRFAIRGCFANMNRA
jgi:hypothetical protein